MPKQTPLSLNDRSFIENSVDSIRIDGRNRLDYRSISIKFEAEDGTVEVTLGNTRVLAVIRGEVQSPRPDRPSEGFYIFNTEFSPMASIEFDGGRQTGEQIEIGTVLEKTLKNSKAIDTEALCILSGEKVWCIRCTVHILDACGNIIDAASIALITALFHFRRNDVTVVGNEVTIHPKNERPPVPLSIHHIPLCVTFAFFSPDQFILDPQLKEEQAMESSITIAMNPHREICHIHKSGGTALSPTTILQCAHIAAEKVLEVSANIKQSLEQARISQLGPQKRKPAVLSRDCRDNHLFATDTPAHQMSDSEQHTNSSDQRNEIEEISPSSSPSSLTVGTSSSALFSGVSSWQQEEEESGPSTPPPATNQSFEMEEKQEDSEEEVVILNVQEEKRSSRKGKKEQNPRKKEHNHQR